MHISRTIKIDSNDGDIESVNKLRKSCKMLQKQIQIMRNHRKSNNKRNIQEKPHRLTVAISLLILLFPVPRQYQVVLVLPLELSIRPAAVNYPTPYFGITNARIDGNNFDTRRNIPINTGNGYNGDTICI